MKSNLFPFRPLYVKRGPWVVLLLGIALFGFQYFLSAESGPASIATIGFQNQSDLFECLPGDHVRLEKSGSQTAMRWDVKYKNNQQRVCVKKVKRGALAGSNGMRLKVRSDSKTVIWLQVNEASGEGFYFYETVTPSPKWRTISLGRSDLTLSEDKGSDGQLDMGEITEILILSASGSGAPASGKRTIWLSDWVFTSSEQTVQAKSLTNPAPSVSTPLQFETLSTGKVGLSAIPFHYQESEKAWVDVFTRAKEMGVQVLSFTNANWREVETSPGHYDWRSLDKAISIMDKHGFNFEFVQDMPGPYFHDEIVAPKDIRFRSFTDPVFLGRYKRFVTSFLTRLGRRFTSMAIHAEGTYSYFKAHPKELDDYCQFLNQVRAHVHQVCPHLRVGVNIDPHNKDYVLARIGKVTDFVGYDIMKIPGCLDRPADLEKLVKRLIRLQQGKRIAFVNAGWSTSKVEKSNEGEQAVFIRELYRVLFQYRDKIAFACFYCLYDEDKAVMKPVYKAAFPNYPDEFVDRITESMGRFGVFRPDGRAKLGWDELKRQISAYYQRRSP